MPQQLGPEIRSPFRDLPENILEVLQPSKRAFQQDSTIATKKTSRQLDDGGRGCEWGKNGLHHKQVDTFPEYFRGSRNKNLVKARRWWKSQDAFCPNDEDEDIRLVQGCTRSQAGGRRRMRTKAVT